MFNNKCTKIILITLLLIGSILTKFFALLIDYVLWFIMSKDGNRVILEL